MDPNNPQPMFNEKQMDFQLALDQVHHHVTQAIEILHSRRYEFATILNCDWDISLLHLEHRIKSYKNMLSDSSGHDVTTGFQQAVANFFNDAIKREQQDDH